MVLSVFICEDNALQRKNIEKIVSDCVALKNYDCKVVLSTDNPDTLLKYVEGLPTQNNFFILDVNLNSHMNGLALGQKIRSLDPFGSIIFVTTHVELALLTFQYRVEAMDYISKDNPEIISRKICDCLDLAYQYCLNTTQYFQLKSVDGIQNVSLGSILFFEGSSVPHKLILHTTNERIEFRGNLRDVQQAQPFFFRSHKSFVVNIKNIKTINRNVGEIIMSNGEVALVTQKKMPALLELLGNKIT